MHEKKTAKKFNADLDRLLRGEIPAGKEDSAEYQGMLAAARRLAETDFSAGITRKEASAEKIFQMAQKELPRQERRRLGFEKLARAANLVAGAALLVGLVLGLSLLFNIFIPGPGSSSNPEPTPTPTLEIMNTEGPITVEQAESMVLDWYIIQKPDLNPETVIPLVELTTPEIWERLGVQVFQVSEGNYHYETFLIRGEQVIVLGSGFGGFGVTSLAVTDLDGNGSPELVFSFSFGSGIHQSRFGLYKPENDTVLDAGIRFTNGDLELNKIDDQNVEVFAALFGSSEKELVGTVNYSSEEGEERLTLTIESGLSPEVLENLGGDAVYGSPVPTDPAEQPSRTPTDEPTASVEGIPVTTPAELLTPSAQELALTTEDLGEGWMLDSELINLDAEYFLDRGEDGKAVISTERRGYPIGIDPSSVESVSIRGFSQPELKLVLFQVLAVFPEAAQAEEELKAFMPDCAPPLVDQSTSQ